MLITKLKAVIDKSDSVITVEDITGSYLPTNTGGYGSPNLSVPDVKYVILDVAPLNGEGNKVYLMRESVPGINSTALIPLNDFLTGQKTFSMTSLTLAKTKATEPTVSFPSGVVVVSCYTVANRLINVKGNKGDTVLTGSVQDILALNSYDGVVSDYIPYTIKPATESAMAVTLEEPLKYDVNGVYPFVLSQDYVLASNNAYQKWQNQLIGLSDSKKNLKDVMLKCLCIIGAPIMMQQGKLEAAHRMITEAADERGCGCD